MKVLKKGDLYYSHVGWGPLQAAMRFPTEHDAKAYIDTDKAAQGGEITNAPPAPGFGNLPMADPWGLRR